MKLLCLCPTFLRPHLIMNLVALFERQTHKDKFLLVLDDAGQLYGRGDQWRVVSVPDRASCLMAKYNAMLRLARLYCPDWDAVALMDDDDLYAPDYLSSHALALENSLWSYPERVWSLHQPPALSPTQPGLEKSGGRFWASAAVRRELLADGFQEIQRPTFDQEHLQLWRQSGPPGRPDSFVLPAYCYGWGRAPRHVSLEMGDLEGWYENYGGRVLARSGERRVTEVGPLLDEQSQGVLSYWESLRVVS